MSRKDEIKRLWADTFSDSSEFVGMYFDRVYRESDALTILSDDGHVVSSLLLQPYGMTFHGATAGVSYISGAATRRNMRGRGLMTALMAQALEQSRSRGDILTLLIPASDYLYYFYSRFGFARAIFTDIMRYTALHMFAAPDALSQEEFVPVDDLFDSRVYEAMTLMEREAPRSTVLHSHRDFLNILDDLRLDGGHCVAVASPADGSIAAIAWARPDPSGADTIRVDAILHTSPGARLAALRRLRALWPGKAFAVMAPVADDGRQPTPRGMARIVNTDAILAMLAAAYPSLHTSVRVTDPMMDCNSGSFILSHGTLTRITPSPGFRPDLDTDITTLTDILFSAPSIGDIIGLPSRRLHMSLMLD